MFGYKKLSLNRKIMMIAVAAIVPMICLVCYLLWTISYTTGVYADITNNVAEANEYVRDFKERIDYTTYLAVINNKKIDELDVGTVTVNGILTVDPYAYIDELKSVCNDLARSATVELNKSQMVRLKNTLNTLSNCIHDLENNIGRENSYDQNMATLDNDVYALTSLVQSCIRDYIYAETLNFDQIKAQLDENNRTIFCFTILASLFVVILTVGLSVRASRNITGPIRNLCTLTSRVAEGDFTAQTKDVESEDEIALLMDNFNDMTKEIGQLVEDMKRNHETLRLSETKLLQAQINPHFLYNTLEIIRSRAMRRGSADVAEMAEALGMLFRYCINSPGELATLAQELDNVHHYLLIQRYRYGDRFTYEEHIENEDVMDSSLPVMTLQPLVENALSHGINRRVDGGKITMRVESIGSRLQISVEDNGVGIAEDELHRVRKNLRERSGPIERRADSSRSTGIALRNVNRRIQFYFGMQYGVDVASTQDIGTTVIVTLPQMRGN